MLAFITTLLFAPPATAADASMRGLFGTSPAYETMTGPNGERCDTTCQRLSHGWFSTRSAERAVGEFVAANGTSGNTVWAYSMSTVAVIDYLNKHPEDSNTYILVGSPAKPGNGNSYWQGGRTLTNTNATVVFVTAQGDSVAQPRTGGNLRTHLDGYDGLDATQPTTSTAVRPNVTDNVYDRRSSVRSRAAAEVEPTSLAERRAERRAAQAERREARAERREAAQQRRTERREAAQDRRDARREARAAA